MAKRSIQCRVCSTALAVAMLSQHFQAAVAGEGTTFLPPVEQQAAGDILAGEDFFYPQAFAGQPRWSARVGAVILQRARPASERLILDAGSGEPLLNPDQLVFPLRGGVDAGLLWRGTVADVDFRYFGVERWTANTGTIFSPGDAILNVPPGETLGGPFQAYLAGASSLHSAEINLRRNATPRWTWLVGLRYLSFRDVLSLVGGELNQPPTQINFGTANNLFGLQIGADAILWTNTTNLRVESAVKAGVYTDGVGITLSGQDGPTGEQFRFAAGADSTAFVGDLSFVGVYQLNPKWAVRAGYQLLWLSGVATGSTMFHGLDFSQNGPPNVITSATVFFHGALLGMERSW